jgi:predicted aspartyl protease
MIDDMGIFRTTVAFAPLAQPDNRRELEVRVDTGSEYNWVPRTVLAELGVEPQGVESFETADGRVLEREVGSALLYAAGRVRATVVVFAEVGDMVLLGAMGLEALNLRVDLTHKKLVPAGPVPVAGLWAAAALLAVTLLASVGPAVPPLAAQATPTRPNVVFVMMDDLGYGDLGSYGGPDAKTPNIDRLAREGVRLTDAYANGAVCTPTRTALITGRYQRRVGLPFERALTPFDTAEILPVTGTSLPALLKANGYATALIGKWHLGFKA